MIEQKTQELMTNIGALLPLIVTGVLTAIGAIVILLIGLWLSRKVEGLTVRTFARHRRRRSRSTAIPRPSGCG